MQLDQMMVSARGAVPCHRKTSKTFFEFEHQLSRHHSHKILTRIQMMMAKEYSAHLNAV
jgi:hypothetical protein